jgi:hypothetical protein
MAAWVACECEWRCGHLTGKGDGGDEVLQPHNFLHLGDELLEGELVIIELAHYRINL